ncbi:MAG: hypothetical protein HC804_01700 [Anaerolineae bacterium]|nr:hypothetical protein [Anaerolineae bacterium]
MTLSSDSIATLTTLSSLCGLVAYILVVAGLWKTFTKAGKPGWPAIIPILNLYFIVKVSGRPGWWLLLFFVPILNIVIWLLVALDTANAFGKTTLFGILIFFLPWIAYLLLGFSDANYQKPVTA